MKSKTTQSIVQLLLTKKPWIVHFDEKSMKLDMITNQPKTKIFGYNISYKNNFKELFYNPYQNDSHKIKANIPKILHQYPWSSWSAQTFNVNLSLLQGEEMVRDLIASSQNT